MHGCRSSADSPASVRESSYRIIQPITVEQQKPSNTVFYLAIQATWFIISMFPQQSPDSQPPPLSAYPRLGEDLRFKNGFSEYYNYGYGVQATNSEFNDLKSNPNFMNNCGILNPIWNNQLDTIGRPPQMPYPAMGYSHCTYNQFPSHTTDQYQMHRDNSMLWQHMKTMAIDPLNSQNYQRLSMDDYNAMLANQCSKTDGSVNSGVRDKECVGCGVITGNARQKDNNGHFLCLNCFRSNSFANPALEMIPTYKRNQLNKNLARKQTSKRTGQLCSNCKTENTTLWRRDKDGHPVCNACGLYYRLHKTHRPPSMRKETLQTRKRKTKKKQNICIKLMDQEYPIKSDLSGSLEQQMMSSPFSNVPAHMVGHHLNPEQFESPFPHHGFEMSSQTPGTMRSANMNHHSRF